MFFILIHTVETYGYPSWIKFDVLLGLVTCLTFSSIFCLMSFSCFQLLETCFPEISTISGQKKALLYVSLSLQTFQEVPKPGAPPTVRWPSSNGAASTLRDTPWIPKFSCGPLTFVLEKNGTACQANFKPFLSLVVFEDPSWWILLVSEPSWNHWAIDSNRHGAACPQPEEFGSACITVATPGNHLEKKFRSSSQMGWTITKLMILLDGNCGSYMCIIYHNLYAIGLCLCTANSSSLRKTCSGFFQF